MADQFGQIAHTFSHVSNLSFQKCYPEYKYCLTGSDL